MSKKRIVVNGIEISEDLLMEVIQLREKKAKEEKERYRRFLKDCKGVNQSFFRFVTEKRLKRLTEVMPKTKKPVTTTTKGSARKSEEDIEIRSKLLREAWQNGLTLSQVDPLIATDFKYISSYLRNKDKQFAKKPGYFQRAEVLVAQYGLSDLA